MEVVEIITNFINKDNNVVEVEFRLRNDGEDMRIPNSTELPDDSTSRMNMGPLSSGDSTGSTPPLSTTKMGAMTPGEGVFSDSSTTNSTTNSQGPSSPPDDVEQSIALPSST